MATGDLAAAMSTRVLEVYGGRDVTQTGITMPGAAGGLRRALEIDPVVWPTGEKVFLLFECEVGDLKHEVIEIDKEDTGRYRRVHILKVTGATVVDAEFGQEHVDQMREKIRLAEEEAAGITRIPFGDEPEDTTPEPGSLAAEVADMADRYPTEEDELPGDLDLADDDEDLPDFGSDADGFADPLIGR